MSDAVLSLPRFSFDGQRLAGAMPLFALARVCCRLADKPDGVLTYQLQGGKDAAGCLFLTVQLSARLPLVCQRCLEAFTYPLTVNRRFWLRGAALPRGAAETIGEELEGGEMPLREFLSDELLLSLPAAPHHKPADCRASGYLTH